MDLSRFPTHSTDESSGQRSSLDLDLPPTTISHSDQALFGSYAQVPAFYQQPFDLTASLQAYNITPRTEAALQWTLPHQDYSEAPPKSSGQPSLPTLAPRLDTAQSVKSEEDDDTSEPTSPREEAIERRKEVCARLRFLLHLSHCVTCLLKILRFP